MQPESRALLLDVQKAALGIASFIDGLTPESYAADLLRKSAAERQLMIIGEALTNLRRVDPATAGRIPDLARIIGMRNVLAHGYAVVVDDVVWQAASTRVPALQATVEALLAESA